MSPVSSFQLAGDAKRVAFLTELLRGANASLAAARANLNRGTVYRWKLEDPEFAAVWAEIAASRPRRRNLRRRILGRRVLGHVLGRTGRLETSQLATPPAAAGFAGSASDFNDLGPPFRSWR